MNNNKWSQLTVKSEKVKLTDDIEITVTGLTFKELGNMARYQDKNDFEGAMNYILTRVLTKAPEVDNDEVPYLVDNLNAEAGAKIVEVAQKLMGLDTSKNDVSAD